MRVKFARDRVALNGSIELLSIEGRKPDAKARQLVRGKILDGFLDAFGGGHV
jgi:hypothetical protein